MGSGFGEEDLPVSPELGPKGRQQASGLRGIRSCIWGAGQAAGFCMTV